MSQSSPSQYYSGFWREHVDGWTPQAALTPLKWKLFSRFVTPETTVLDVGCGDGSHYGRWLASIAHEYHGLDISDAAVASARQYNINAQRHDLQSPFPFSDEVFDTVLCIGVLEHLFAPAYALREMRRVIKSGGRIILSVPNIAHFSNRLRLMGGAFAPGGSPATSSRQQWADPHIRFFTVKSLNAFIAEQQLQCIELYGEAVSFFSTLPLASRLLARRLGWERLERWSQPFEFMARVRPSLFAGHLIAVARRVPCEDR
jgi:methionine biosynthesis protein MetW